MIDLFQRWRVWIMIVAFPGHESETKMKDMLGQGSEVTEVDGSLMSCDGQREVFVLAP